MRVRGAALEFASRDERELELMDLIDDIGMNVFQSPSVFNFYQPDYQPRGPVARAELFAPEARIAAGPKSFEHICARPAP